MSTDMYGCFKPKAVNSGDVTGGGRSKKKKKKSR
ncbi:hypothetical protein NVP1121O_174 [Vibrio phage 1.121.O._10N.286.46.C4]|nr:hypothetical protein NVP1121O_174 [Vibrio phage 1.121.O._10N.286.46.C4]